MVDANRSGGTWRAPAARVTEPATSGGLRPRVWIVEDEPAAAELAADVCDALGAHASIFRSPLPFLAALRSQLDPAAVILDWRLERELSSALFMATRHRYPDVRVVYWTGSPASQLPAMIRQDVRTVVVDKADGTRSFERALGWALAGEIGQASVDG